MTGGEDTEQARDADLARVDVDADLRELRAVGVHREPLRLRILSDLAGRFEPLGGNDTVILVMETRAEFARCLDDR